MSSQTPKHVVSLGLGSSTRDSYIETRLLEQDIILERRGSDGDMNKLKAMLLELDGKVDAFGLGGTDLFFSVAGKKYYLRESVNLAKTIKQTPIVCGAGLKDTLERFVVKELEPVIHWQDKKVLMVSAVDRYGMAETLDELGANMIYGDFIFGLGINIPIRSKQSLIRTAKLLLPIITQVPIQWLYPTGNKQEQATSSWRSKYFDWADIIAGDFHFIRRYAPQNLKGKIILTNTTTKDDVKLMQQQGVKTLITTTPRFNGRSLSTNLLDASFVALANKYPLTDQDYRSLIQQSGIKPDLLELN